MVNPNQIDFKTQAPRQPKKDVSFYVKENSDILIPQYFNSTREAFDSGKPFILRSESPHEFAGFSGLLESIIVDLNDKAEMEKLSAQLIPDLRNPISILSFYLISQKDNILNKDGNDNDIFELLFNLPETLANIIEYCDYKKIDFSSFKKDFSFSCWEYLTGLNGKITADSAVRGRYHIQSPEEHIVIEDELCVHEFCHKPETIIVLRKFSKRLIDFYETIRNLPAFCNEDCPIIEFNIDLENEQIYFLQYHKTISFKKALEFKIAYPVDSIKALLVRGSTPACGRVYTINLSSMLFKNNYGEIYQSFLPNYRKSYIEAVVRIRKLVLIKQDFENSYFTGHVLTSMLFKPELSMIVDYKKIFTIDQLKKIRKAPGSCIKIKAVSNGREGYIQAIGKIYRKWRPLKIFVSIKQIIEALYASFIRILKPGSFNKIAYKNFVREACLAFDIFYDEQEEISNLNKILKNGIACNWFGDEALYYSVILQLASLTIKKEPLKALQYLKSFIDSPIACKKLDECEIIYARASNILDKAGRTKRKTRCKKVKILLVDDEKISRLLMEDLFKEHNFGYCLCEKPRDALIKIEQSIAVCDPFNVIVTDYLMDGMSGIDLLKKVFTHDKDILCFLLTAFSLKNEITNEERDFLKHVHIIDKRISNDALISKIVGELEFEK